MDNRGVNKALQPDEAVAVESQLARVLESEFFRSSGRCCRFLAYSVKHLIEGGTPEQLKERVIGCEVFNRSPDYDTAQDNVVRVTATDVRKRLAQYYGGPGESENPVIDLSPGSYAVTLHWRSALSESMAGERSAAPEAFFVSQTNASSEAKSWLTSNPFKIALVIIAAALLVLSVAHFFNGSSRNDILQQVWSPLLEDHDSVLVCISQPTDAFTQSSAVDFVPASDSYVGVGDAYALAEVAKLLSGHGKTWRLLAGKETPPQDLKTGPVVLIGSYSNPWTLKLTQKLRFVFSPLLELAIEDRSHPGKRWAVADVTPPGKPSEDYAIVSSFLSPETGKPVLVLAGVTNFGTQAAGEFITSQEMLSAALQHAPKEWGHRNFQFVLHTNVIGNSPEHPTVVASDFW